MDSPHFRNMRPVFFVFDRTVAWKLIGFLAMLSGALPVALSGDRPVARVRFADFPVISTMFKKPFTAAVPSVCCSIPRAVNSMPDVSLANFTAAFLISTSETLVCSAMSFRSNESVCCFSSSNPFVRD